MPPTMKFLTDIWHPNGLSSPCWLPMHETLY
jgi:hypothetical protein